MPRPYPIELRERAVAATEAGDGTYHEVAAGFGVSPRSLEAWVARLRAEGTVAPRQPRGGWISPVDRAVLNAGEAEA
jgi:transposase-like protein